MQIQKWMVYYNRTMKTWVRRAGTGGDACLPLLAAAIKLQWSSREDTAGHKAPWCAEGNILVDQRLRVILKGASMRGRRGAHRPGI